MTNIETLIAYWETELDVAMHPMDDSDDPRLMQQYIHKVTETIAALRQQQGEGTITLTVQLDEARKEIDLVKAELAAATRELTDAEITAAANSVVSNYRNKPMAVGDVDDEIRWFCRAIRDALTDKQEVPK